MASNGTRMNAYRHILSAAVTSLLFLSSCSTVEKASLHGFSSGYYRLTSGPEVKQPVYVDLTAEKVEIHRVSGKQPEKDVAFRFPLGGSDSLPDHPLVFTKTSLDIDLTTILMKYRPSVQGAPAQMATELNVALYAGWRHDAYRLTAHADPLGQRRMKVTAKGYDFGVFAGPGTTTVGPFSTRNARTDEYSGMIIQTGVAGFFETSIASFGIAVGIDHLLSADHAVWIYQHKPWVGFIIGVALN